MIGTIPGVTESLQHVGTFNSDDARLAQIIQESGQRLSWTREMTPRHKLELAETARFISDVVAGRRRSHHLEDALRTQAFQQRMGELFAMQTRGIYGSYPIQHREVKEAASGLSTSDFPILFGDVLDRQLLGQYNEWPLTWPNIARRATVRDFRTVRRITLDGLDEQWYPTYKTAEYQPPHENDDLTEGQYTYAVDVYQRSFTIDWRMLINDDLDAFGNLAPRLARGARRTEERFATSLFVDANGPHASLYTAGNANIVNVTNGATATNPPLTVAGLQDAFTVLMSQLDPQGEPIMIDMVELVVPPALEVTARNILNALQIWSGGTVDSTGTPTGGGTDNQRLVSQNWMAQKLHLNVNPYIPLVATTGTRGNTSWFMFASPGAQRPALEVGFLRGYESPSLFQKMPNTMRLGGAVDPMLGDFDTMAITYKGMHIIGGTQMDGKMTVASNGTGS